MYLRTNDTTMDARIAELQRKSFEVRLAMFETRNIYEMTHVIDLERDTLFIEEIQLLFDEIVRERDALHLLAPMAWLDDVDSRIAYLAVAIPQFAAILRKENRSKQWHRPQLPPQPKPPTPPAPTATPTRKHKRGGSRSRARCLSVCPMRICYDCSTPEPNASTKQ